VTGDQVVSRSLALAVVSALRARDERCARGEVVYGGPATGCNLTTT